MTEDGTSTTPDTEPSLSPLTMHRRRTALLEGACGQAGRVEVCGQVVDLPNTHQQSREEWQPFHNLPVSSLHTIRPIDDLTMPAVKRALLQLEVLDVSPEAFQLEQADVYPICFHSPQFKTKANGFFSFRLPASLESGSYVLRIILRGIDSARQSLMDLRYIGSQDKQILKKDVAIGYGKLRILPPDFQGILLISDIDQTLLDTQIERKKNLLATLGQKPNERKVISGMPELYRQLARLEEPYTPLFFLSASPHFFRRTLASLLEGHGIHASGLYLKYLTGVFDTLGSKLAQLASNPFKLLATTDLRDALENGMNFLSTHILSLFDQIGYKLEMLLRNRLMQPTAARDILIGDNTESDFLIFTLYQLLLKAKAPLEDLPAYFEAFNFKGREALTSEAIQNICELTEKNLQMHGKKNPVCALWLNNAKKEINNKIMQELIRNSLSKELNTAYASDEDICRPRLCQKGLGMALAAFDEGLLSVKSIRAVADQSQKQSASKEELEKTLQEFHFKKRNELSPAALADKLFT